MIDAWRSVRALRSRDWPVAIEAALSLLGAWLLLRLLSLQVIERFIDRRIDRMRRSAPVGVHEDQADAARRIGWAISASARRLPAAFSCLPQALAAQFMLLRRRCTSKICIGVRRCDGEAPLDAHAWVECGGVVVAGSRDDLGSYTLLESRDRP